MRSPGCPLRTLCPQLTCLEIPANGALALVNMAIALQVRLIGALFGSAVRLFKMYPVYALLFSLDEDPPLGSCGILADSEAERH